MDYSIGEVSALLNISRDMIRYYEKQGAIKAGRNSGNNYRRYDSMDVFWLMEAMQHKSWGIPISEIDDIRNHEYTSNTAKYLHDESLKQEKEVEYRKLLSERLKDLESYMLTGLKNIGNFWAEKTKAQYRCHLVRGKGDEYERINLSRETSGYVFSEKTLPFIDNGISVNGEYTDWEIVIKKQYADLLMEELPDAFYELPGELCLCTHVDIGEIGHFRKDCFKALEEYAAANGYVSPKGGRIRGILLGRGTEGGLFHRVVKISIPIE